MFRKLNISRLFTTCPSDYLAKKTIRKLTPFTDGPTRNIATKQFKLPKESEQIELKSSSKNIRKQFKFSKDDIELKSQPKNITVEQFKLPKEPECKNLIPIFCVEELMGKRCDFLFADNACILNIKKGNDILQSIKIDRQIEITNKQFSVAYSPYRVAITTSDKDSKKYLTNIMQKTQQANMLRFLTPMTLSFDYKNHRIVYNDKNILIVPFNNEQNRLLLQMEEEKGIIFSLDQAENELNLAFDKNGVLYSHIDQIPDEFKIKLADMSKPTIEFVTENNMTGLKLVDNARLSLATSANINDIKTPSNNIINNEQYISNKYRSMSEGLSLFSSCVLMWTGTAYGIAWMNAVDSLWKSPLIYIFSGGFAGCGLAAISIATYERNKYGKILSIIIVITAAGIAYYIFPEKQKRYNNTIIY